MRYPWKLTKFEDPEGRIAQSIALVRQLPAIMVGNGFASIVVYFALENGTAPLPAIFIPASVLVMLLPMFCSWRKLRGRRKPSSVSVRRLRKVMLYSGLLGFLWAALELVYLPSAPFGTAAFLAAGSGFLGVGAVAALFMIPQACIAYAAPIMASSLIVALRMNDPERLPLIMMLLLMGVGISAFLRTNWLHFVTIFELSREKTALLARLTDELAQENARIRAKEEAEKALTQANQILQMLASSDGLTGLANRRIFDRALEAEMARTTREAQPLSLLLVDVDHFKSLNDKHGHQAGDECLRLIATTLRHAVRRPGDVIARYGGEEFGIILPNTSGEAAYLIAQRIHGALPSAGTPAAITVSIGISSRDLTLVTEAAGALLQRADEALYTAKRNGRNRTEVKQPIGPPFVSYASGSGL